jgi:O-antigen ligase
LPLAALLLTVVVRQLFNPPLRDAEMTSRSTRLIALKDLMAALWIVGAALAVHALVEALRAGSFHPEDSAGRTLVTSLTGRPNGFGAVMAAGIIAALTSATEARGRPTRLLLAAAVVLQLAALLANGSRGALLGMIAGGLLVLWLRLRQRGLRTAVAGLAALVAVAVAGILLHRLDPGSGRGRLLAWEVSGAMLGDRPLTGVGAGRFGAEWGRYQAELWRHPDYAGFARHAVGRVEPNSELFHRLAERGVPGGALYVLIWAFALGFQVRAVRMNDRTPAMDWGLLALLVAILLHSLVDAVLRWEPTLVTVHLAFGLIPAPVLLRADLRRGWARHLATVVAVGWAVTAAVKTLREYPGFQSWGKASRVSGAARLHLLQLAGRRLRWEPELDRQLGIRLLRAGRLEEAANTLQRGLAAREDPLSRQALAEAQLGLGWLEQAEQNARTAAAGFPDWLGPRLLLARIHHAKGEEAQARAALASSIRRDTHFRSAAVDALVAEATLLWRNWYDDPPPR